MHVPAHADHERHDLDLIAAHVAGDLSQSDRPRADALLQSCSSCADLRRDLIAVAAATRALPRTIPAPRDFRLDAAQAARLRRGSWLRTLLQPFGAPRSAARPMAAAFTTLGLAGLLVANILPSLVGSPAGGAAQGTARDLTSEQAAPSTAAEWVPGATNAAVPMAGGPRASHDSQFAAGQPSASATDDRPRAEDAASIAPVAVGDAKASREVVDTGAPTSRNALSSGIEVNPLVLGSALLLALGLLLFGLRTAARRVR